MNDLYTKAHNVASISLAMHRFGVNMVEDLLIKGGADSDTLIHLCYGAIKYDFDKWVLSLPIGGRRIASPEHFTAFDVIRDYEWLAAEIQANDVRSAETLPATDAPEAVEPDTNPHQTEPVEWQKCGEDRESGGLLTWLDKLPKKKRTLRRLLKSVFHGRSKKPAARRSL